VIMMVIIFMEETCHPHPLAVFPDSSVLPLSAQHPLSHGGHSAIGRVPRSLPPAPTLLQRSQENKLEVSRCKRKT
jgi:hypothetical protein